MSLYFGVFKEPRGLIRILQFIFAIFAFSTASGGGSSLSIGYNNTNNAITASWSYPFALHETKINTNLPKTQDTLSLSNSIKPSAEFFVFTGVTSMLISLAFIAGYVVLDRQYRNDERLPVVDFVITLIWTFFWIVGSSAWGQGVSNIRTQTSSEYIISLISSCSTLACAETDSPTYANVTVSVIFGFLNFLLWLGSIWFVYKETKFFKLRTAQQQQQPTMSNNFTNIGQNRSGPSSAPGMNFPKS